MSKSYKAIFVSEKWHTNLKKMAAQEKKSMIILAESLLGIGKKEYDKQIAR